MADEAQVGSNVAVDVWNRSLDAIGNTKPVSGPTDTSLAATVCRRHYYDVLDEALELRDWSFARKQAQPNLLDGVTRAGWAYAYELPADFVAARGIVQGGVRLSLQGGADRVPHEIQGNDDGDGLLLLMDLELDPTTDALVYTRRHDTVARWPRLFLSAVVYRLASALALAIPKDKPLAKEMLAFFEAALSVAYAADLRQGQRDPDPETPSILARGGNRS